MLNVPKTFTASKNVRSPGFALVITWISQIWSNFSRDIIRQSFIHCGIVSNDSNTYHKQLRHFVQKRILMDDIDIDDDTSDIQGFNPDEGGKRDAELTEDEDELNSDADDDS